MNEDISNLYKDLQAENSKLKDQVDELKTERKELKNENRHLKRENERLIDVENRTRIQNDNLWALNKKLLKNKAK